MSQLQFRHFQAPYRMKLFIKNGVDVSLPISEYQIPLLEAVFGGDSGIVKLLLENGADPEPDCCAVEENQAGQSPLQIAVEQNDSVHPFCSLFLHKSLDFSRGNRVIDDVASKRHILPRQKQQRVFAAAKLQLVSPSVSQRWPKDSQTH